MLITFFGTRERAEYQTEKPLPIRESLGFIRRNSAFGSNGRPQAAQLDPVVIVQAVFAYYLAYWSGMTEDETSISGRDPGRGLSLPALVSYLSRRYESGRPTSSVW